MNALKTSVLLLAIALTLASCQKNMGTLKLYFSNEGKKTVCIYPFGAKNEAEYILKEETTGDEYETDLNIGDYIYNGKAFQIRERKTTKIRFADSPDPIVSYE